MISTKLLSEVLETEVKGCVTAIKQINNSLNSTIKKGNIAYFNNRWKYINIYELAHNHLKRWAKKKSIFDMIDWSGTPKQIFKRADELNGTKL